MSLQEEHDEYVKSLQIDRQRSKQKDPKIWSLDRIGKPDVPATAKSIKQEAEAPIHSAAELLLLRGRMKYAAAGNRFLRSEANRNKKFPFRTGEHINIKSKAVVEDVFNNYTNTSNAWSRSFKPKILPSPIQTAQRRMGMQFGEQGVLGKNLQGMGRGLEEQRNTPSKIRKKILENRINPTIEELEQAVVGPGVEGLRPKPIYERPAETPLVKARNARPGVYDWTEIGKRLQKQYGGSDGQIQAFIQLQLANKKQIEADLVKVNEKAQFDYLEFAATAMEALDDAGYPTGELTDDDMYKLFVTMASNPKAARVFDKGHIRSAKNIWRETKLGTPTTADYRSNLAIEQKASIRDFMRIDPKTGEAELIIPGNIKRGSRTDAPKIVDMLRGTSPNVDIEYQRFLEPEFNEALTDIVPFQRHGHFMEYLRGRIKKWQGRGKDRLIGKQQLDQYRGKLNEFIDDYLNEQELGEWELDDKAKSDFIDDIMRNRKPLHKLDLKDEKDLNKLLDDIIFRRIAPDKPL